MEKEVICMNEEFFHDFLALDFAQLKYLRRNP